jgi:hypothetical protein
MSGQEVIMGNPAGRGSPVITGLTLLILGLAALLLLREGAHGARDNGSLFFLALLGSPLTGLAALAVGFRRHVRLSLIVLVASGVHVAPIVRLLLAPPRYADIGLGIVWLVWDWMAWFFVAVAAIAGHQSLDLESQRIRTLFKEWLEPPPQERSGVEGAPSVPQAPADSSHGHKDENQTNGDRDDASDGTRPGMSGPYIRMP